MAKTILLILLFVSTIAQSQSVRISGPNVVCPQQTYTYNISGSFIFGQCGSPRWDIWDQNGNHLDAGYGSTFTYAFDHPQNVNYTITASASGGIGCLSGATTSMGVTTRYPVPTIRQVSSDACSSGQTVTFVADVNADFACFHHVIDWQIPPGWTASFYGNRVTLTVPSPAPVNQYLTLRARVQYDDLNPNTFGNWRSHQFAVGKPQANIPNANVVICTNQFMQQNNAVLPVSIGADSYQLTTTSPYLTIATQYPGELVLLASRVGNYIVTLTTSNDCGSSQGYFLVVAESCIGGFDDQFDIAAYPNPASSELTIEDNNLNQSHSGQTDFIAQKESRKVESVNTFYTLYDFRNNVVSQGILDKIRTIDVSRFENGRYVLIVQQGDHTETHHILIEK